MRNILLILYFVPFFVAQDAHYLNYLHCRLVNIAQPVNQQCDCEQILSSSGKDQAPVSRQPATHVHAHLDVYFLHEKSLKFEDLLVNYNKLAYPPTQGRFSEGVCMLPWRPPALQS